MIDKAKAIEIYEALEANADLIARWVDAKVKLCKKIFGTGHQVTTIKLIRNGLMKRLS